MTNTAALLALLVDASESLEEDPTTPLPAHESADFRTTAEELITTAKGEKVWVCTCSELIEGRWESFASMRPALV